MQSAADSATEKTDREGQRQSERGEGVGRHIEWTRGLKPEIPGVHPPFSSRSRSSPTRLTERTTTEKGRTRQWGERGDVRRSVDRAPSRCCGAPQDVCKSGSGFDVLSRSRCRDQSSWPSVRLSWHSRPFPSRWRLTFFCGESCPPTGGVPRGPLDG